MALPNTPTRNKLILQPVVLANGNTSSEIFISSSFVIGGIIIPAGFSGTKLNFYGFIDDSATSYEVTEFHNGTALFDITYAADKLIPIDFRKMASVGRWKLVSDVIQVGDITINLLMREIY